MTIVVNAWADVACPLSYLCHGRLGEAIRQYRDAGGHHDVAIDYHSIELASDTPADYDGNEIDFLTSHRGMSPPDAQQALARLTGVAAAEGVALQFDRVRHANSRLAHQLVHHAKAQGRQVAMLERLWPAYFTEGADIADLDVLAALAGEIGLDSAAARDAIASGVHAAAIDDDIQRGAFYRIRVLPFFLIGPKYGVSGAHDVKYYVEVLNKAAATLDE
jgi:predicted DsbA family dithiol-disulfide isomerase